jgi:hypothetical protein
LGRTRLSIVLRHWLRGSARFVGFPSSLRLLLCPLLYAIVISSDINTMILPSPCTREIRFHRIIRVEPTNDIAESPSVCWTQPSPNNPSKDVSYLGHRFIHYVRRLGEALRGREVQSSTDLDTPLLSPGRSICSKGPRWLNRGKFVDALFVSEAIVRE